MQRSGQYAEDSNKIANKVGSPGNPPEEPDSFPGRRAGTYRTKMCVDPIISNEPVVKSEASGSFSLFGLRIMCQQSSLDMLSEDGDDI